MRKLPGSRWRYCTLAVLLLPTVAGPPVRAETLYNGIVLPDEWPPAVKEFTREPMPVPYLDKRPDVIPIDVGRQLFVDDFLVEETTMKRTYHTARCHPATPVLKPDRPWETRGKTAKPTAMPFSDGVWYDPQDRLFKMWYMGGYVRSTCFATSRDGIHWEKPTLDVVPGTNIVLDRERDSNTVWLDLGEANPARRYKMFTTVFRPEGNGVRPAIHYSADGIHWGEPLAVGSGIGDRTTIFFNPFRQRWVYSIRHSGDKVGRARLYAECEDLVDAVSQLGRISHPWTNADRLDPRNPNPPLKDVPPQLYNLDAVAYESILLGLFSIWQGDPGQGVEKRNEVLLGNSRDGFHWHRPDHRALVGVNETDGAWNWGNVQSAGGGCLVVGDQLYFYVSGRGRGRTTEPAVTGLAVLRRDGFASMDADGTAALTTRPVVFSGKYLFTNANVAGGELRVEVLDRDGHLIPPFAKNRCIPVTTDATLQAIRWQESPELSSLAGTPVRFRFHVARGKLYSFWVSPDESGASRGYVAAGGPGFTEPRDTVGRAVYEAAAALAPAGSGKVHAKTRPND